jgi:hypothetical protein
MWLAAFAGAALLLPPIPARAQQKDYLTSLEADKIRDAELPSERIKLFVGFAADRIKKVQYELGRTTPDRRRGQRVNDLLNAYTGCIDDAAELIELGVERQHDIREGIKELEAKGKEFLPYLEKLAAGGQPIVADFKDTLDDSIEATRQALRDAEKAEKEMAPPPVRRKP